jgi:hypothetical protein
MAKAINLRARTRPKLGDVVIIDDVPAELSAEAASLLAGLHDLQHHSARREGGHVRVNNDAKRMALAFLDELRCH